jgi:LacI family transcriptional regulator
MSSRRTQKPTIREVAADCGLSIATVSAVVNKAAWVPEPTRLRVERSIEALGYRPNRLARGLKTSQSYTVGVIVSDITNPYFTDIVRSLGHVLREHERHLVLSESEHEFDLGERNLRMLIEKQVDAVVLVGDSVSGEVLGRLLAARDFPIVSVGRSYDMEGVSELLVDTGEAAFEATSHLLEQGYKNLVMISGPSSGSGSQSFGHPLRLAGFRRALRSAGIPERKGQIEEGNFRIDGGKHAMETLLELNPRPDAVFAANDLMAFGALEVLRERGLSVPNEVGVVGCDNIPMAAYAGVPLTTIDTPREQLGREAAELILENISDGAEYKTARRIYSSELVVRQSSLAKRGDSVAVSERT